MYSRCLERGSEEYTFSEYTRNIMDGSPELLFLDGSSGRSTKRDRSSSSVTNSSMATFEPGLSGSVSQSDLDTPHIATHERSGSESTAKSDDDNMKGHNNNGSSSSSSSGRHLGNDTGSSWDSERVGDADGMVPNTMPRKTLGVCEMETGGGG